MACRVAAEPPCIDFIQWSVNLDHFHKNANLKARRKIPVSLMFIFDY